MEAFATSPWTEIGVSIAAFALGVWWFFSAWNPLWNWLERRPKTLESQEIDRKFHGLILFGLAGSHYHFQEIRSGDSFSFVKCSGAGESRMVLTVDSKVPDTELARALERQALLTLRDSHTLTPSENEGDFDVKCDDPASLSALSQAVVKAMNHLPDAKYRCVSGGPTDNQAFRDFFGLDDHAA